MGRNSLYGRPTRPICVTFDPAVVELATAVAEKKGVTRSHLINQIVGRALRKPTKKRGEKR